MQLEVIRQDKSKHQFMRGMLAHKLIQRGLSFDQAYQIAEDAKSFFHEQAEVTSESLMKSVDELIISRYGESILKKLNSRRINKHDKKVLKDALLITIAGVAAAMKNVG